MNRYILENTNNMAFNMLFACTNKVIDKTHPHVELSADELTQFNWCMVKYMKTPDVVFEAFEELERGN